MKQERNGELASFRTIASPAQASPLFGYERAITIDWDNHNARRHELIEIKRARALSDEETREYVELQWLAGLKRELGSGPPPVQASVPAEGDRDSYRELPCAGCGNTTDTGLLLCPTCVDEGREDAPERHSKTCDRWVQCGDHEHYEPIVNCSCTTPTTVAPVEQSRDTKCPACGEQDCFDHALRSVAPLADPEDETTK